MKKVPRQRADRLLVERGLFDSRAKAQAAIAAGLVIANKVTVRKASETIAANADLRATPAHPYVSRGGLKLAAALDHFGFDPHGRVCLDVGASTGGFTQVLLERGAKHLYAIDVGRGQLHELLRRRPEVVSLEETDIRTFSPARLATSPDLIVIDVSFISLKLVLPAALALAKASCATCCADQAAIRGRTRASSSEALCATKKFTPRSATISQLSLPRSAGASSASSPHPSPAATAMRNFCWAPRRD